jgi:hypothetical protein
MGEVEGAEERETENWEEAVSDGKRAAVYVRVSIVDQETGLQEMKLLEYCHDGVGNQSCTGIEARAEPRRIVRH